VLYKAVQSVSYANILSAKGIEGIQHRSKSSLCTINHAQMNTDSVNQS